MRKFVLYALLTAFAAQPVNSLAEVYPTRPIRMLVGSSAGGLVDQHARLVAQGMSKSLGQPVVVENRPGASGLLAVQTLKTARADGYTVLVVADSIATQPALRQEPAYDLEKDFAAIGQLSRYPFVLVTGTNQPYNTFADFVARARAQPGATTFASSGAGSAPQLAALILFQGLQLNCVHVPYKGNAGAMPDVIGGRVDVIFAGAQQLRGGLLKPLGVSSLTRLAAHPTIPTLAEQRATNYTYYGLVGLLAAAGTPPAVVQRLSDALRAASDDANLKLQLAKEGSEVTISSPDEFAARLTQIRLRTAKMATELGLKKE